MLHIFFYLTIIIFYLSALKLKNNFFNSKKFFIILAISLAIMTILKISMVLSSLILIHYLYIIYKNKNVKIFFNLFNNSNLNDYSLGFSQFDTI